MYLQCNEVVKRRVNILQQMYHIYVDSATPSLSGFPLATTELLWDSIPPFSFSVEKPLLTIPISVKGFSFSVELATTISSGFAGSFQKNRESIYMVPLKTLTQHHHVNNRQLISYRSYTSQDPRAPQRSCHSPQAVSMT